jgi:hypothetical protein
MTNQNDLMKETMDRRRFLRFSGTCALAVLAGSACTRLDSGEAANAISTCPYALINDPYPGQCVNYVDSNDSGYCDLSENLSGQTNAGDSKDSAGESQATATQEPTEEQAPQTATAAAPTEQKPPQSSGLVVLCHRGCSYPGHCRRFRDQDGSGICDLSEGIDPSEL